MINECKNVNENENEKWKLKMKNEILNKLTNIPLCLKK